MRQEDFARKIGVGRTTLANWEAGTVLPDVGAMVRLSEWLGIPLEWIFQGHARHVERDVAGRLELRAVGLGAGVVGYDDDKARQLSHRQGINDAAD